MTDFQSQSLCVKVLKMILLDRFKGIEGLSAILLNKNNINRIALISHDWHFLRVVAKLKEIGLAVVPAPMGLKRSSANALSFLPNASELVKFSRAMHEWLGIWAGQFGVINQAVPILELSLIDKPKLS